MVEQKIVELLKEKFQEEDFSDCFLIELKLHANNKLEIFIDSDSGVTFSKCQKISRHLEKHLDENAWLGEKYTLEVSSPGVGRPLRLLRQYHRNVGRKLEITPEEGDKVTGTLLKVEGEVLFIEHKVRVQEGKKKKTQLVQTEIPFDNVKQAIVKISFS